ncbi:hypothetical protein KR018_011290 [Drosophila ironensis]|nr:hypothetical protein KR018_011290 [Drosophila ironensis]
MDGGTKFAANWIGIVVFLVIGPVAGEVLRCYNCTIGDRSCGTESNPHGAPIECPNSTMCSSTVHTMNLPGGRKWTKTLRNCAWQTVLTHVLNNKRWEPNYSVVKDAYNEGCTDKDNVRTCYCTGSLCNSSSSRTLNFGLTLVWIFVVKLFLPV